MTFAIVASLGVLALLFFYWQRKAQERSHIQKTIILEQAENRAKHLIDSAKLEAKELVIQARVEAEQMRSDAQKTQQSLTLKQEALSREMQKLQEIQKREKAVFEKEKELQRKMAISEAEIQKQAESQLEQEYAKLYLQKKRLLDDQVEQHAHQLVITCLGRLPKKALHDATVTEIPIASEEVKAKIIGREGKNIKAFQQLSGSSLIVDETPGIITLSCFDPQRRDVARAALEALLQDGRITPERIEEELIRASQSQDARLVAYGQEALDACQLHSMHPLLLLHLGRLKLRASLGQNLLEHSIEVAKIMGLMAEELKLNVSKAMRMGLLHDIGKASDTPLSHALAGYRLCQECGESQEVANGVGCHHDEMPAESQEAALVKCADYLSGARRGARADSGEQFFKRLKDFEAEALRCKGVKSAFALQAGRELQVFVRPELVSEADAVLLAKELAGKIRPLSPTSPVQISVIRETKSVEYSS